MSRELARRSARGPAPSSCASSQLATPRGPGAARPTRPHPRRSSAASSTGRARGHAEATRCTAICCGCGAKTRVFNAARRGGIDGAVLGPDAFVLRFFGAGWADRLLLVNLGARPRARDHAGAAARAARRPRLGAALVERAPGLWRDGNGCQSKPTGPGSSRAMQPSMLRRRPISESRTASPQSGDESVRRSAG